MDEHLRKKIEAALFSVGKKMHIDQIVRLTKEKDKGKITACLIELKKKYEEEQNSLMILQDGDEWKLTIKDEFVDVAKELGVETELSKTVMETLAVIAYKNPAVQSDVIRIRTNKAYDHLKELEELGYIARERWGRTKRIKLTPKFFEYFDLPPESLKETFSNVKAMEDAIREKEHQAHEIKEKKKELLEEQKREERELERQNIFIKKDNNVREVIKQDPHGMGIIIGERLGDLEVIDESEPQVVPKKADDVAVYDTKENDEDTHDSQELENKEEDTDERETELAEERPEEVFDQEESEENEDIEEIQALKDSINQDEDLETDSNYIDEDVTQENSDTNQSKENETNDLEDNNEPDNQDGEEGDTEKNSDDDTLKKDEEEQADSSKEITENIDDSASENYEENNEDNENETNVDEEKPDDAKEELSEEPLEDTISDEDAGEEKSEEKPEEFHARKPLKEEELFNMEGIPPEIMKKIEEESEEITGERPSSKNKEDFPE